MTGEMKVKLKRASVKWFRWWFIPAVIILLTILCNMDCGGKSNKDQTTANTRTGTPAETTVAESEMMILPRLSTFITYAEEEITEDDHGCYVNDIILVSLNPETSEEARNHALIEVCEAAHGELLGGVLSAGLAQIYVATRSYDELKELCSEIAAIDNVEAAAIDFALEEDDDALAYLGYEWWENAIYAEEAWQYLEYVKACRVGIIDGPVDGSHEDLIIEAQNTDLAKKYKGPEDHGTHVAGIIGALHNDIGIDGVNPKAALYTYAVGSATFKKFESYVISGIDWLLSKGVRVVNASVGAADLGDAEKNRDAKMFETAILSWEKSYGENFIIVQSAGNNGWSNVVGDSQYNGLFAGVTNKALLDHIVIVANATWEPEKGARYYSLAPYSQYGSYVTIAAPGTDIYSTIPGNDYKYMSGTSMSAPMVTGVLSLIWGLNCDLSPDEVKSILVTSATEIAYENPTHDASTRTDYPFLNAKRAAEMAWASTHFEIIEADPGQDVDIEEIKLYNKLIDFLGESFDKVQEYYGVPDGGIGMDENGACLSYLIDGNYILFAEVYEGTGTVNEIQVVFQNNDASEILLCSGVSSHMKQADVHSALSEYHSEAHITSDALTVNASSETANMFFSWNPAATGSMSFVRLEAIR